MTIETHVPEGRIVYTLGYTRANIKYLDHWAKSHDVKILDIRFRASSMNPVWTGHNMRNVLGNSYVQVREFGNINYKGGNIKLLDAGKGFLIVEQLLIKRDVLLLCVCPNHTTCHRSAVSSILSKNLPVEIKHLTPADINKYYIDTLPPAPAPDKEPSAKEDESGDTPNTPIQLSLF